MSNILVKIVGEKEVYCGRGRNAYFAKTTVVDDALFITLVDEKGEKTYFLDGRKVSKEEGNKRFLELKKMGTKEFNVIPVNSKTAEGLIEWYMKGYDQYTEYIDNYKQQQAAEKHNRYIHDCVDSIHKAVEQEQTTPAEELTKEESGDCPEEKKIPTTKEEVKQQILESDEALYEALYKVYQCQTDSEKASESTKEYNGIGFNGVDAPFLSSLAKSLEKYGRLTPKQTAIARKKMVKYSGQVFSLMMA